MTQGNTVVVDTPYGRLAGEAQDGGVARFLGIPYAKAPVGALRLRGPRPLEPWTGTRDARTPAPASLQTLGGNQVWMNEPIARQSEDCLYLNVWTPGIAGRAPVLFWLHGGQTRNGHGAAPGIDGSAFAQRGIVVVTINYRLGGLGGLAHPDLEDDATGFCANWSMQDKLAALDWVGRCIAVFGGDPARVTLAGQSSGGANAVMIAQHRLAEGRYSRLIAQSPPLFRPPMFVDMDAAAEYTEAFAVHVGTNVTGLRERDGVELQRAEHAFAYSAELVAKMGRPRTAPVRDGRLLRAWPYDAGAAAVPALVGWTREEANFWFDMHDGEGKVISPMKAPQSPEELAKRLGGLIGQHYAFPDPPAAADVASAYAESGSPAAIWRDAYTDLVFRAPVLQFAGAQARAGARAWVYEFAHALPSPGRGSPHATDVPLVFGTWRHPHFSCKLAGSPFVEALSEAMMSAWVAFVIDGNPGSAAGLAWPAFDPRDPTVMRFGPARAEVIPPERPRGLSCWPRYAA